MQVHEQYEQLRTKTMPKAALVIGGVSEKMQIQSLRGGSALIIATPGRLQDFIDRRLADLSRSKCWCWMKPTACWIWDFFQRSGALLSSYNAARLCVFRRRWNNPLRTCA